MSDWTSTTLLRIDEDTDRERATNGYSRYGVYLRDRMPEFNDLDLDGPMLRDDFALAAWSIATPPILTGYVLLRPDLTSVKAHRDENGHLVMQVTLPLRHAHLAPQGRPRYPWQDWAAGYSFATRDDRYQGADEPEIKPGRPAVLASVDLLLPTQDWNLPTPQHTEGRAMVEEAKEVVHEIVRQVNIEAGPMVAQLLGDQNQG